MTTPKVFLCYEHHCLDPDDCSITVAIDPVGSEIYDVLLTFAPTEIFIPHDFEIPEDVEDKNDYVLSILNAHFRAVDGQGRSLAMRFCDSDGSNPQALFLRDADSEVEILLWDEDMEIDHQPAPDFVLYVGSSLPGYPAYGSAIPSWYAKASIRVRLYMDGAAPSSHVIVNKPGEIFQMYPYDTADPAILDSLVAPGMTYSESRFDRDVIQSRVLEVG